MHAVRACGSQPILESCGVLKTSLLNDNFASSDQCERNLVGAYVACCLSATRTTMAQTASRCYGKCRWCLTLLLLHVEQCMHWQRPLACSRPALSQLLGLLSGRVLGCRQVQEVLLLSAVSHPAVSVHDVKQYMSCPSSNSLEPSYGRWCSKSVACRLRVGWPEPLV